MHQVPSACDSCIHRLTDGSCEAFTRIPDRFIVWGESHTTPIPDQKNRVVWEFAPGTEPEFEDWKSLQEAGS